MDIHFKRWSENGLFWFLFYQLQQAKQINIDVVWVDSTTIAVHLHGGGALKKKTSLLYPRDKDKIWLYFAPFLPLGLWQLIRFVIGDKGYESYKVRKEIKDHGCIPVIPLKQSRVFPGIYDKALEHDTISNVF